jgi:uncharacterized membrane protein YphA (DoxX/SURF4 family)
MKLTAATTIAAPIESVWEKSQDPAKHQRWDLRFTSIKYLGEAEGGLQKFEYATRLAALEVKGWGQTRSDHKMRGSKLLFGSDDPKSLIRQGEGCWIYRNGGGTTQFETVYDYDVRFGFIGRTFDSFLFRPLMQWATRWSFDRLRLWIETGQSPEFSFRLWAVKLCARVALGLVWVLEGLIPKVWFIRHDEVELVARSNIWLITPELTLQCLGLIEMLAGIILLLGFRERSTIAATSLAMMVLSLLVLINDPAALTEPYGGIIKNATIGACGVVVWLLAPLTPNAVRGRSTA